MIISRLRRFVYIAPPRTGSTTLHRWLSQPALCEVRWSGNPAGQHDTEIPVDAAGHFVFASVRHPCARAVSLWSHGQTADTLVQPVPQMTFPEFVDWLPSAWWFFSRGQAEYLEGVRLDGLVRVEYLEADLLGLPPIVAAIDDGARLEPLPRLNPTKHPPWESLVTSELRGLLEARWPGDLALWEAAGPETHQEGGD